MSESWIFFKGNFKKNINKLNNYNSIIKNISCIITNNFKNLPILKKYNSKIHIGLIQNINNRNNINNELFNSYLDIYIINCIYPKNNIFTNFEYYLNYIYNIKKKYSKIGIIISIKSKYEEYLLYKLKNNVDYLILVIEYWKVIILENIITNFLNSSTKILLFIKSENDIRLSKQIMGIGINGIITRNIYLLNDSILKYNILNKKKKYLFQNAIITKIKHLNLGDRACIDTCYILDNKEGMLIGSQSSCLFLVISESFNNFIINTRPFRVNAGSIHSYIQIGENIKYITDLCSGDNISIVSSNGTERIGIIGRIKIEKRPLVLIEVLIRNKSYSIILQYAETIRLAVSKNRSTAVTELKIGDSVLVKLDIGGRHFGKKIDEFIIEK